MVTALERRLRLQCKGRKKKAFSKNKRITWEKAKRKKRVKFKEKKYDAEKHRIEFSILSKEVSLFYVQRAKNIKKELPSYAF